MKTLQSCHPNSSMQDFYGDKDLDNTHFWTLYQFDLKTVPMLPPPSLPLPRGGAEGGGVMCNDHGLNWYYIL